MNSMKWKQMIEQWLQDRTLDQHLPEIAALRGVLQPEKHHAEGDVFTHSLMAVDAVSPEADERVFWAVLLHDVGKATTTEWLDGRWRSLGHERAGALMVPAILARFDLNHLVDDVVWLVKHHGFALSWGKDLSALTHRQQRFCCEPLFSLLVEVATADAHGSIGSSDKLDRLQHILDICVVD